MPRVVRRYLFLFLMAFCSAGAAAQRPSVIDRLPQGGRGGTGSGGGGNDSFARRDRFADSLTLRFYSFDSSRPATLDTGIIDFYHRFPTPPTWQYLGNPGNPAQPMLYQPPARVGFYPGFHAFDPYRWDLRDSRFYSTTRPYTELAYLLGSGVQQMVSLFHTQNIRPYWNFSFGYRLMTAPGTFSNQTVAHNNYSFTSWYTSPSRRYNNYLVLNGNKLLSGENGGIQNDTPYLNIALYDDRLSVPTNIGFDVATSRSFFGTKLEVGSKSNDFSVLLRQQYDLGKKDSIVTDSTIIPLFYPRLRFQHTLQYQQFRHSFFDRGIDGDDSLFYKNFYNLTLPAPFDTAFTDRWRVIHNDFSLFQFPDIYNLQQFIQLGAAVEIMSGTNRKGNTNLFNTLIHAAYRNRTRNRKWDLSANGRLYLAGYNAGDYHAYAHLERFISPTIGTLRIGGENINRSPAFRYDNRSEFYLDAAKSFKKENTFHFFGQLFQPRLRLTLGADYYLVTNYLYISDYYRMQQESTPFNLLRISASRKSRISNRWSLYSDVWLQQKAGNVALNVPLLLTRQRLLYEGTFGFPNLRVAFGLEARYHTPYKADNYSPLLGAFSFQDTTTLRNRPDLHALFHFRIRSFKAYIRAENLNTIKPSDGFAFRRHNFGAPNYPYPGMILRFGFFWTFVN